MQRGRPAGPVPVQVVNGAPAPAGGARADATFRHDTHPRSFDDNRYVYAVLSRRAHGVSIGINLSPSRSCNFDCVYCQVDRSVPVTAAEHAVDEARLLAELRDMLDAGRTGILTARAREQGVPDASCRVADVAFSGDGEPTAYARFPELVDEVLRLVAERLPGTRVTLITNATLFHLPRVRAGLDALAARGGQVWAKLDAGTEATFRETNRSAVTFDRVLDNIREEALRHPLVVQSLFFRRGSSRPDGAELDAWVQRLAAIVAAGGRLAGVQVTTVARRPPQPDVVALDEETLLDIARRARAALPGVPVEVFPSTYGAASGGRS